MLERLKAAAPPLVRVAVRTPLVVLTGWLLNERLLGDRLTVAEVPVPLRLRDCGLPLALSVKLTEADRLALAVGSNVTLTVQLAPAATEVPQVLVCAKSPALAPVSAMLERLKAAAPPLVRVAVSVPLLVFTAWLPNERLLGDRLAVAEVPVPLRLRDCGLPLALSVKLTEADRLALAVGSNVTLTVQLAPAATEVPQVLVCAKSPALAPVSAMLERLKAAAPPLVRVAVSVPLLVFTAWLPNERLLGDKLTVAEVPVPLRLRDCGLPLALSVKLTEADRLALAVGSNVTLTVQLAPAATEVPQVLVCAKSPALAPVSAMLERLKAAAPPLVRVAVSVPLLVFTAWLPNERLLGDRLAVAEVPVPLRLRDCGLPLALSVKLTEADRLPLAVGSNVTLTVQLAPAGTELPQVFV